MFELREPSSPLVAVYSCLLSRSRLLRIRLSSRVVWTRAHIPGYGKAKKQSKRNWDRKICCEHKPANRTGGEEKSIAINKDEVHKQISTEMYSESCSDDLWLSLSSFMDDKGQESLGASAASQSLMGLSSSLFNDVNSFVMDKEVPAEYVPAPAISAADLELNTQLESVLYMLKEVLPGPMVKVGMDNKLLEAWSFISDDIKVQDPLVCLEGKDRLWVWLHSLTTSNPHIYLDEIYAERSIAHPFKRFVHALWTLVFPKELQSISKHPSQCVQSSSLQLNLSGESKFEVDRSGQIISIESNWYVTKEGEDELDSMKSLLTSLLCEAHN